MSDQWHVSRAGEVFGPYTSTQLQELASIGRVAPTDMVCTAATQQWYSAAEIQGLFPAPPAFPPEPPRPAYTPEPEPEANEEEDPSPRFRPRRQPREGAMSPLYWMLPIGGASILGLITAVILIGSRTPPKTTPQERPRSKPVGRKPTPREPTTPLVEMPEAPVDYTLPKVDYARGPRGEDLVFKVDDDNPNVRYQMFLDDKGMPVLHGKREEMYPGTQIKKIQQWWANGKLYGSYFEWDDKGNKTVEGQFARNLKNGKWLKYAPSGNIIEEAFWYRGKKHGPTTTYHANGKKSRLVTYKQDRRTGPAQFWDEAGKPLGRDISLKADLVTANYDEMIDILGSPTEVHEARASGGELYLWQTGASRFIAIWVSKDASDKQIKGPIKGFQVSKETVVQLKEQLR